MFQAVIVDDEKPALDLLRFFLEESGQIHVSGAFLSGAEALTQLEALKPDVAFLDIEMPGLSGLELAEKITDAGLNPEIVFVTAYDQYALEAFRVNAIDYILKPFSAAGLGRVIARLQRVKPLPAADRTPRTAARAECFGRLSLYGPDAAEPVKWRTTKAEELFAFMLQNRGQEVPKWKITGALWPEWEEDRRLNVNLHTTVYKVKKTLCEAKIPFRFSFRNGAYQLDLPGLLADTDTFRALTEAKIDVTETTLSQYRQAFALFRGPYLGENEYLWCQSEAAAYAARYRNLVSALVRYDTARADGLSAERTLRQALAVFPLEDTFNEMLLTLLFLRRDKSAVVMHYNKIEGLYQSELGILPTETMQRLYRDSARL